MRMLAVLFMLALLPGSPTAMADEPDYGANLEHFEYPYPVHDFVFESQRQALRMAYMDVRPEGNPVATAVLLHGKNFCGAYWHQTIDRLVDLGYRVVVPDQVGFCKSMKPDYYQYSFAQLAANTHALLDELGVEEVVVLGHSMGGMLATRYALQYPEHTRQLIMLNPIGLEDWRAEGVPHVSIDRIYQAELARDFAGIREYQKRYYYDGEWNEEHERWARMLAGMYGSEDRERVAWNQALTADMVLSQPVLYQFDQLRVPTVLLIGLRDRTAIGRDLVDEETAGRLGDYRSLGRATHARLREGTLVEFDDIGHMPHIEAPERYLDALEEVLR